MNSELSVMVVLKKAWESFKSNMNTLLSLYAVIVLVNIVLSIADRKMSALAIVSYVFSVLVTYVLIKSSIMSVRGEKVTKESILEINWLTVFWLAVASICYGLIVGLGVIALVIPGVIAAIRFFAVTYVLIDEKLDIVPSFKRSLEMTKGHGWEIFLLSILLAVFSIAFTVVTLGIGALLIMPACSMVGAVIYEKLRNNSLPQKEEPELPAKTA